MKPHPHFLKRITVLLLSAFSYQLISAQNWIYIASIAAQDIDVGRSGTVWAATNSGNVLRWSGTAWENIPGTASRLAVDGEGAAWVVTSEGQIYKYDIATRYWQLRPGTAKEIGIGGDGSVFIIGTNAVQGGYNISKWDWSTGNWKPVSGGAVKIAVEPSGNPWIVDNTGNVFRYTGSAWEQKPGNLKDIGIGANGTIWCTGPNDAIYKWDGTNWQGQSGGASWVSVAPDGNAWVVNAGGEVWRTNNAPRIPDFTIPDLKGVQRSLYGDLRAGKTVILDFSAIWCNYCNISAPALQTVYNDMRSRKCNVNVYMMLFEGRQVGVPCDSTTATVFATRHSLTLPIIINIGTFVTGLVGQYTSQYLQSGIPFFMIITPNVNDPGNSSIQIITGEFPNLVQMIEEKIPAAACRK